MIGIVKHGMLDTIQDLGRYGFQKYGVVTSGAMDMWAHRIANILVGNDEYASTLEMTMVGPHIQFEEDTIFAVCGGHLLPTIDGVHVPMWRPVFVRKNTILQFGHTIGGSRAYLAVGGGFSVPSVMNSQSTYLRAKIGGLGGRALRRGDRVRIGDKYAWTEALVQYLIKQPSKLPFQTGTWFVRSEFYSKPKILHVTKGKQFDDFTASSREAFFNQSFKVDTNSDRMGYRLNGPKLSLTEQKEMISEPVSFGSIQVPADGNPILLTADRQTTGGYPKIAQVSTSDFSILAQAKPGDTLFFKLCVIEESQRRYIQKEEWLKQISSSIQIILRGN